MGTTVSYITITNKTKYALTADCSDTDPGDWDGESGDPQYTFKSHPVRIPPGKDENKRVELYKPAANSPYQMTLTFDDGSKDTFKVNQKWAIGQAPLNVRKAEFDHVVEFDRDYKFTTLQIDVRHTILQDLAYECSTDFDTITKQYKDKKYVDAECDVGTLLAHIKKILDDKREDKVAKKLVQALWKPSHVLAAKIKFGLATVYKKESIKLEAVGYDRSKSWRYFERSKEFVKKAIEFSQMGEDMDLTTELKGKQLIYEEKMRCNKLFNEALDNLEKAWESPEKFHEGKDVFNDPVNQTSEYLRKYGRIMDACNRNENSVREFNRVRDAFKHLIDKDGDYKGCLEPIDKVIAQLLAFYPKLRKSQLRFALNAFHIEKSDQQDFLWEGEGIVEIQAPRKL